MCLVHRLYSVLHVCPLLLLCRQDKEAQQTFTFCFLLGDNFKSLFCFCFFFLHRRLSAACTGLLVLLKRQLRGTSPRPGWLASQWVAAFEIHRDSPKQREPPHSPGKWCPGGESGQHTEQTHRSQKRKSHLTHTQTHSLSWGGCATLSRCRCWWVNAEAGTHGDAGWSPSPERRH